MTTEAIARSIFTCTLFSPKSCLQAAGCPGSSPSSSCVHAVVVAPVSDRSVVCTQLVVPVPVIFTRRTTHEVTQLLYGITHPVDEEGTAGLHRIT